MQQSRRARWVHPGCNGGQRVTVLYDIDMTGGRSGSSHGSSTQSPDRQHEENQQAGRDDAYHDPSTLHPGRRPHPSLCCGNHFQPRIERFVFQLKGDRHRISFFEHLFATPVLEHEHLFAVNHFLEHPFAGHGSHVTEGV